MVGSSVRTELLLKLGPFVLEVAYALTRYALYCLNFFSTLLSSTALVATVIEPALMASAPTSGASNMHASGLARLLLFLLFLRCNQRTTENHHACAKHPFSKMSFAKQQPCPHNRKDGAELEERSHISNVTQSDRCKSKKWCDPCNADRHEKRA